MANSQVAMTEGSGKNAATYSISEGTTKEIQRMALNTNAGVEIATAAAPLQVSVANTGANATAIKVDNTAALDKGSGTSGSATQRVIVDSSQLSALGQTTSAASAPVVIASDQSKVPVHGDTASGSSDANNPVKIGGVGRITNPTAVTDGQRVNGIFDKLGKQIVVGAIRDLKGNQQTSISNSTSETTIVTAVASTFLDLYGLILANTGATTTKVSIRDDTAGTVRAIIEVPTLETRGFMLPVDSAIPQTAVNKNWTATCASATTAMEVTALFVKNL